MKFPRALRASPWILCGLLALWGYVQHRKADGLGDRLSVCEEVQKEAGIQAAATQALLTETEKRVKTMSQDLLLAQANKRAAGSVVEEPGAAADTKGSKPFRVTADYFRTAEACLESRPLLDQQNASLWNKALEAERKEKKAAKGKKFWRAFGGVSAGLAVGLGVAHALR